MIIEKLKQKIDISAYSSHFIQQSIKHRMFDLGIVEIVDYANYFESSSSESDVFENLLKNSYSLFFRNRLTFETLGQVVLPVLMGDKREVDEIRIWSTACAGGHEPYSLAIAFEKFNRLSSNKLKYRIFATDRDFKEIEHAIMGNYSATDIENLTISETKEWFLFDGKYYKIKSELKKNIQFEIFDLLDDSCICPRSSIFGTFDFIMCANVLIYYNAETQNRIVSNLKKCVSKHGFVLTGETEREIFINNNFIEVFPQSCIFKF
ncbi:MAG: hypothetical protein KA206_06870 [Paludibacter sp.]|nr:hypothetical protein [Paludibacter sp.]